MKHILSAILAIVFIGTLISSQEVRNTKPTAQTITGYLVDMMCAKAIMKAEPAKRKHKAMIHTRECALDDACAAEGYAVISDDKMFVLDTTGNKKAYAYLQQIHQNDNIKVDITGMADGGMVKVISIKESKSR